MFYALYDIWHCVLELSQQYPDLHQVESLTPLNQISPHDLSQMKQGRSFISSWQRQHSSQLIAASLSASSHYMHSTLYHHRYITTNIIIL